MMHPLQIPALRGVIEGLVSGLIQVMLPGHPSTLSAIIEPISEALQRHANIRIDLNQHTKQAKLVAAEHYLPSTLPIDTQRRNNFSVICPNPVVATQKASAPTSTPMAISGEPSSIPPQVSQMAIQGEYPGFAAADSFIAENQTSSNNGQ